MMPGQVRSTLKGFIVNVRIVKLYLISV